jgi:PTH1 family peptidyl-tRNA hydrolase
MTDQPTANAPFLITGLGNPGPEYRHTRHNVGFMLVDAVAAAIGVKFTRIEMRALATRGEYQGHKIILAKPQTFMNLSGQSVGALARYYKVPTSQVLIAYDDVDLPLGTIRIRHSGGSAGQKGMASIIEKLGTQDIPRMRLGIGRPPGRMEAAAYVLQEFSSSEAILLKQVLERAAQAALRFVSHGLETAMNEYNGVADLD